MNHPERILRLLDSHLAHPVRLILYGRAALALGFPNAAAEWAATLDVDAILPTKEMPQIEADEPFWEALDATNKALEPSGLYLTHLFLDTQVILSLNWLSEIVELPLANLRHLTLFRPSNPDLILTKMMRIDPQDRADLLFLLSVTPMSVSQANVLFQHAQVPDIPEIHEAFQENARWLLEQLPG